MRYFVYCRKSTDREDRQILGTDAQKRLLLEHAGRHGLTVVDVYVENQTAYKTGRPLFSAMLQRLEKGEKPNPFIDPAGYKEYVSSREKLYTDQLAHDRGLAYSQHRLAQNTPGRQQQNDLA